MPKFWWVTCPSKIEVPLDSLSVSRYISFRFRTIIIIHDFRLSWTKPFSLTLSSITNSSSRGPYQWLFLVYSNLIYDKFIKEETVSCLFESTCVLSYMHIIIIIFAHGYLQKLLQSSNSSNYFAVNSALILYFTAKNTSKNRVMIAYDK